VKALVALALLVAAQTALPAENSAPPDALDDALRAIAMTKADLSFRTDYADHPDSFRLAAVDSLLTYPLDTEGYVCGLADKVSSLSRTRDLIRACALELDIDDSAGSVEIRSGRADPDGSPRYEAVSVLLPAARNARERLAAAFAGLSAVERDLIRTEAAVLLERQEFDPEKPLDERERESKRDERLGEELLAIAGRVDYGAIVSAGASVSGAVDLAVQLASDSTSLSPALEAEALGSAFSALGHATAVGVATGDVLACVDTDVGIVVIGGPGPTTYLREAAITIDVGGDDLYACGAGGACEDLGASVVIDLSGDDTYRAGTHALGAGYMGIGVLIDLEGDDAYYARNFSLGSGLFGVGLLIDRGGDDIYVGDTCTEGSGAFGIGVLRDEGGNDSYDAALFSQAFGFVMGFGLLVDSAGNDTYTAGGKYTDEIRYFDHFISLSQGFGFGWRPDASGGIGLLADRAGNDVYISDIFGQASSYWFAVGGLVDYSGNDQYVSYQYAQGAGIHITVAALADLEGSDNYVAKGVSQGCGHDLAIGILHDLEGDDSYICHDLSQGAGNANGIGVLIDDGGDDAYVVRNPDNTHGYGNLRRDYGSVGIFIDSGGTDSYAGRGRDNTWWTYSTYGIGTDSEAEEEVSPE
jgi:hypothetical protein